MYKICINNGVLICTEKNVKCCNNLLTNVVLQLSIIFIVEFDPM